MLGMGRIDLDDLAQLRDLVLQRVGRVGREIVAPAGLDELVGRRHMANPKGQKRQHDALLLAAERRCTKVGGHLQRAEYPYQHVGIVPRGPRGEPWVRSGTTARPQRMQSGR